MTGTSGISMNEATFFYLLLQIKGNLYLVVSKKRNLYLEGTAEKQQQGTAIS